jgi:serpin B
MVLAAVLSSCGPMQKQDTAANQAQAFTPVSNIDPAVGDALTGFSLDLFKQTVSGAGDKNELISPLSVWLALCMTYNGASGGTAQAMASALHASGVSMDVLNTANKGLMGVLTAADPQVQADIANSIWLSKAYSHDIGKNFLGMVSKNYGAELQTVDFNLNAADTINGWVAKKTHEKIPQIVQPPMDANTVLLLVNAVYFKAPWSNVFDPTLTHAAPFTLANGKTPQAWYMVHERGSNGYADNETIAVRLPYASGRLEMVAIMPEKQALPEFISSLDAQKLNAYMDKCSYLDMSLAFPKFKVESGTDLKDALTTMGMGVAFDRGKAEFGNMSESMGNSLWIGGVKHEAFIEVNEQGTEAGAASRVDMVAATPPPVQQLDFSKPFLYLIRDKSTGAILFIGTMQNPS